MSTVTLNLEDLVKKRTDLEARYAMLERQLMTLQNEISYTNGFIDAISIMKKDDKNALDKS